MKKNTKNRISACLIVKNEEKMLPRCLNSLKHLIDELIIVDTGSEDNTVKIAESFGAKIYHHPWENNFTKHRNQSISYATGDWIIFIDADEEFNGYHLTKADFKKKLKKMPKVLHCLLIRMLDKNDQGRIVSETRMIRMFRNKVGVRFEGIIHEAPVYSGKVGYLDIEFFHYGYALPEVQMQAKYKRNIDLLLKRIEKNPKDHDAYFYLFQVYSVMKERQKTIKAGRQCLELLQEKKLPYIQASFYYSIYHGLASLYRDTQEYEQAHSIILEGLKILPDEPDLYYDLASIGHFSNQPDLSIEGGQNYLRVIDDFRNNPSKAGTRFIFTTSKNAEVTVSFWLILGLISFDRFQEFLNIWEKYREPILEKTSFPKIIFEALEKKEAFDVLGPVAVFLFNRLDKIPVSYHTMIFSFLLFYLSEQKADQNEIKSGTGDMFESIIAQYFKTISNYNTIPTGDAVILANFFLGKNKGDLFLDLTLAAFNRELAGQLKVIDNKETIIQGYKKIAGKQKKDRKGRLIILSILDICKQLLSRE
nr:glycosyltransferase family 2 protein [uncultured Desulfobacter sp.]